MEFATFPVGRCGLPWTILLKCTGVPIREQYANKWLANRGLDHHPLGVELKRLLTMVDVGLLYDGLDAMNSAAFELIARRCY